MKASFFLAAAAAAAAAVLAPHVMARLGEMNRVSNSLNTDLAPELNANATAAADADRKPLPDTEKSVAVKAEELANHVAQFSKEVAKKSMKEACALLPSAKNAKDAKKAKADEAEDHAKAKADEAEAKADEEEAKADATPENTGETKTPAQEALDHAKIVAEEATTKFDALEFVKKEAATAALAAWKTKNSAVAAEVAAQAKVFRDNPWLWSKEAAVSTAGFFQGKGKQVEEHLLQKCHEMETDEADSLQSEDKQEDKARAPQPEHQPVADSVARAAAEADADSLQESA